MTYDWVGLSLLSAFGQAFGWALKKKSLESKGVNNTLGAVSFAVAGVILAGLYVAMNGLVVPVITPRFVMAAAICIVGNIIAVWAAYRALDRGPLSLLMPFVAVTSLAIVPIEYFVRGVAPNGMQIVGIVLLVAGAISFTSRFMMDKHILKAMGYFAITVLCYSFGPPFMGVAVDESGSGLFSAAVFHVGIALGFIPFILMAREGRAVSKLRADGLWVKTLLFMLASGAVIALLENGPATVALETAKAGEIFSLKRTMPFFALILGVVMFGEKVTKRHILATCLLVTGSVFIILFK